MSDDVRGFHLRIARLIAASRTRELSAVERKRVEEALGQSLEESFSVDEGVGERAGEELDVDTPTIICTSMSGAKGMSAAYVFIVGMVDGHFPRDPTDPTDSEVRKLIVSLTRAKVRCHLISCGNYAGDWVEVSSFLSWIGDDRIRLDEVNNPRLNELEARG